MNTKRAAIALGLLVLVSACDRNPFRTSRQFPVRLEAADGSRVDLSSLSVNAASVFVFLAPDCPLSQNYTLTLNEMGDQFASDAVRIYGVVSGRWFEPAEVDEFVETYRPRFPVLLDEDFVLADFFDATVTPEAFVTDAGGDVLYEGAIDDWAGALGQHRRVITARYLEDALAQIVLGQRVEIAATQAIGCYLERPR